MGDLERLTNEFTLVFTSVSLDGGAVYSNGAFLGREIQYFLGSSYDIPIWRAIIYHLIIEMTITFTTTGKTL